MRYVVKAAAVGLLFMLASAVPSLAADPPKGLYALKSVNTPTLCMGVINVAAGSAVAQTDCSSGANADQEWTLTPVGSTSPQQYALVNNASGLYLDVAGYSTTKGAKLDQWTGKASGNQNQLWTLVAMTNGSYEIVSVLSHMCVDDPGYSKTDKTQLDQWTCVNGASNQSWQFVAMGSPQPQAVNGQCGSANGVAASSAPSANLCSSGSASAVSGTGPWQWSCSGSNGGTSASCSAPVQQASGGGGASGLPVGWPANFVVGLGVWQGQSQISYLQQSGMPQWGAIYSYLSGGINSGWQGWGSGYVAGIVNATRKGGSLPIFTYYMLVGSPPNPNDGQPQTDLNTASTMAAYFADFTALMKQLGAVGGPVAVEIEPDMWGYLQSGGLGQSVSVASSGNADLAGIPNTVAGLGQAYLTLRDKYAPNVILGPVASVWSWSTNTNCSFDAAGQGKTDAAYLAGTAGSKKWDLLFSDVAYGDAGAPRGTWWDANNVTCPNFNVLNKWAGSLTSNSGLRLVLWQTPMGNTYRTTTNNTNYHWQDNKLQYWLQGYPGDGRLAALANSGVIGILFNGGEPNPTLLFDAAGDGITGNETVPDDDGGALRAFTGQLDASPLALH